MAHFTNTSILSRLASLGRRLRSAEPVPCWTDYLRETANRAH